MVVEQRLVPVASCRGQELEMRASGAASMPRSVSVKRCRSFYTTKPRLRQKIPQPSSNVGSSSGKAICDSADAIRVVNSLLVSRGPSGNPDASVQQGIACVSGFHLDGDSGAPIFHLGPIDHTLDIRWRLFRGLDNGFAAELDSPLNKGVAVRHESLRSTDDIALAGKTAPLPADNGVPLLVAFECVTEAQGLPKLQGQSEVERQCRDGSLLDGHGVVNNGHRVVCARDRRLVGKSEEVICTALQMVALSGRVFGTCLSTCKRVRLT